MKHLHICHNDKFIEPFINFIYQHFDQEEHKFIVLGKDLKTKSVKSRNIIYCSKSIYSVLVILKQLNQNEKIYLHGLFIPQVVMLLFFQPWILKKCKWVVWGGDLYSFNNKRRSMNAKLQELMRRFVINRLAGLITHIKGDYDLAKEWYGTKGKYFYSFLYPSNLYKEPDLNKNNKFNNKIIIQVGNSADVSNNHFEVFEMLFKLNNNNFEIFCPLSYGDSNYANQVIQKGNELFGQRFKPLTNFINYDKYIELLAQVDIAIFNHKRQQAVGNITTLLSLGKKVYISEDITTWDFCIEHGLKVYGLKYEFQDVLIPLQEETKMRNKIRMKEQFSEEKLVSDWKVIFSSKI